MKIWDLNRKQKQRRFAVNSKKKLLILGATGMAGHVAYIYLNETGKYDIATVCHSGKIEPNSYELDIYDTDKLIQIIEKEKPDAVINCSDDSYGHTS